MTSDLCDVTITVQPFHGLWEVFELPGIQPLHSCRSRAIAAARRLLKNRPGVIVVRDEDGLVDELIEQRPAERAWAA